MPTVELYSDCFSAKQAIIRNFGILSSCVAFLRAGDREGNKTEGDLSRDSDVDEEGRDDYVAETISAPFRTPLSLPTVIGKVIPAALNTWEKLAVRTCSGSISSGEAWDWFGAKSLEQREHEVRLLFESGGPTSKASLLPPCEHHDATPASRRRAEEERETQRRVNRVLASLGAHASSEWFLSAIPGLLHARIVLQLSSSRTSVGDSATVDAGSGRATSGEGSDVDAGAENDVNAQISGIFSVSHDDDQSYLALENILQFLRKMHGKLPLDAATDAWKGVIIDTPA